MCRLDSNTYCSLLCYGKDEGTKKGVQERGVGGVTIESRERWKVIFNVTRTSSTGSFSSVPPGRLLGIFL